jgi:nitrate/nitrite transport system ATP-binding protein
MHRHPHYYPIRNHLIEFLVDRSRHFAREMAGGAFDPRHPKLVHPGLVEPVLVAPPPEIVRRAGP